MMQGWVMKKAGNPTWLTVPAGVTKVRLKGNIGWTFGGSGYRHVWMHKNGALFFGAAKESDEGDAGVQSIGTAVVEVRPAACPMAAQMHRPAYRVDEK
jgi:hypothetical protein